MIRAAALCLGVWTLLLGIPAPASAQTLAGGAGHSVVLKSDGSVWAFGSNNRGQIGDNSTTTRSTPVQVGGLSDVVAVAAGAYHTMALTSGGVLYVWGSNSDGQVGNDSTVTRRCRIRIQLRWATAPLAANRDYCRHRSE